MASIPIGITPRYRTTTTSAIFPQLGLNQASTTYQRSAGVGWSSNYWSTYVQVYKYQTLQDPDAPLIPPYDKVPELYLRGARYDWGGFDVDWTSTAVRFRQPLVRVRYGPDGDRLQSYPTISIRSSGRAGSSCLQA